MIDLFYFSLIYNQASEDTEEGISWEITLFIHNRNSKGRRRGGRSHGYGRFPYNWGVGAQLQPENVSSVRKRAQKL